jgi:hypothetical protein
MSLGEREYPLNVLHAAIKRYPVRDISSVEKMIPTQYPACRQVCGQIVSGCIPDGMQAMCIGMIFYRAMHTYDMLFMDVHRLLLPNFTSLRDVIQYFSPFLSGFLKGQKYTRC